MSLVGATDARALFGGDGRILSEVLQRVAQARVLPAPLQVAEEANASRDLRRWIRMFEQLDLEVVDPADTELRSPGLYPRFEDLLGEARPSLVADVVAALSGSTVVAQQNEMSFLASWAGSKDGASRVFYFHPSDWGVWPTDASLAARLFRIVQEEERPEFVEQRYEGPEEARLVSALKLYESQVQDETLPQLSDPGRLFGRIEWLVDTLLGLGRPIHRSLERAAPLRGFAEESKHLGRYTHLALYWLWTHFFLGNRNELDLTLSVTAEVVHPWVQDSRQWLKRWLDGERAPLGGRSVKDIERAQERLAEVAPPEQFSDERRREVRARRRAQQDFAQRDEDAVRRLHALAEGRPEILETLDRLDRASSTGALPPTADGELEEQVERLCQGLSPEFRELVELRLERAAAVPDSHRDAGWGLLEAAATVVPELAAFEALLKRLGTTNFGPRRTSELYRAYARFDEDAATDVLAKAAQRWLSQLDDWIRTVPSAPVLAMLQRDVLATHDLIAAILERASYGAANVEVCVEAARAAGRLRSHRAVTGLRRAVRFDLGRVFDGGRADVVAALWKIENDACREFLLERMEVLVERWEAAEDEDEGWSRQKDLACLMTGVVPAAGDEARVQEVLRILVEAVGRRLQHTRPVPAETLEAGRALVDGIRRAERPGLAFRLREWSRLEIPPRPSNRRALVRLQRELERLEEEVL